MVVRLKILIKFPFKHQNIYTTGIIILSTTQDHHTLHVSIFSRPVNNNNNKLKDKFSSCYFVFIMQKKKIQVY